MKIKTRFNLLVIAVITQVYHMIEHVAQYIQYEFYNIHNPHGLIPQFDTEEIHLIFDHWEVPPSWRLRMVIFNTKNKNRPLGASPLVEVQNGHFQ